jgi:hypothetical protein
MEESDAGASSWRSETNRDVPLAGAAEFAPLRIGPLAVWPPVVLAPMAGVTNYPFRALCREFGAGLFVSEMITARGYLNGNRRTVLLASSREDEVPRSVQVYSSDPGRGRDGRAPRRRRRAPRRHQPRLPGAQGHRARRRLRDSRQAAARRGARARDGLERTRRPGDDEDAQGHRRGALDLPRGRPRRAGRRHQRRRPARAHRRAAVLRRGRLGRDRRPQVAPLDPGARQRRHLGELRRAAHDAADTVATA